MPQRCLECGALLPEGSTCQSLFDELLILEYTDPAYGQVHFLTVACFMIQHGRYSDEALDWIQPHMRAYLAKQITTQQIRQQSARVTNSASRTWKVIRQKDAPPLPKIAWPITIADVVEHIKHAEDYCDQVERWARSILQQMEAVPR